MPIRKGVIPAAGLGTRFLPASKAVPKVLLPIVDRPVIQYAVEEMARAGITQICIVLSHGQGAISDHFAPAPELEAVLEKAGKTELLEEVRRTETLADIFYVQQHRPLGLGHAVVCAADFIDDEPFAVLLPDELFDPKDNFLGEMVETFEVEGASVVAGLEVPHEEICRYGAMAIEDLEVEPLRILSLVEKPPLDEAPSDIAIVGRYVLEPAVLALLAKLPPGALGEIQLTDALDILAREGRLLGKLYRGRRWDAGNKQGFLRANFDLAAERPDLAATVADLLGRPVA
ncbi:MAG: UTP-glucose-phosphate uridylyltransferase [Actinobacteria bacterium]|jgi:UTP--glucose-1-phosphate uridylyltransferase|nr:UTP-glucose-phosphate uridylyltransferase [Actinomycetota bacterium]MCW3041873.1 UTP-glucose-phosphate uridylyltransferase [Actinomycetota bacterium]MEA2535389.1 UTP--glucose-phosphate uridylyltransferase [Actinomycetota bacterium]MEA2567826.1 UTP--glucose-phosphate uridylyltransferase [Actinomycetota bacterium]MEA2591015.1 UTP--glucose-phosphate uridylyltransferase [Actinomycetota bacterium]